MQVLCRNQGIAIQQEDEQAHAEISETARSFFSAHLKPWIFDFCQKIIDLAEEDVYKSIGALGLAFFSREVELYDA